ncbi:SDR family oxidoreductase [Williamsia sp. CHRR-6]|uniref:SDR family oxidoreductase n=1 Tax=Williamsia sp. CHRR-6 TaxID=2835871 RepID=UPI001BDB3F55|nr:SDR family oxidoreductase [Williamsia sp. CHRR-6]MBT0567273.1 SDR family oxidoreductase [Williamsia sp. CHRR-6]
MSGLTCVVTGATGYIGGRLAPRLIARGHQVRAIARTPEKLAAAPWATPGRVVRGDLSDRASLDAAFAGADVVYHLVHSMGLSEDFMAEERASATNVALAAREAGVARIVYLSGLHPQGVELSDHLTSRVEVGEILMASGIATMVLQAGVVIGNGSASFELIRHLTDRLPVMTTPRWVHNKIQPISIRDTLHYLVEAATCELPERNRTWDIGGPNVFEYGEMMQIYAEAAGLRKRQMVVLPFLTPSLASRWVSTVTPVPGGLARPLIESLACDAVMSEHDIDGVIAPPEGGLQTYREALTAALDRVKRADTDKSWNNAEATVSPAEPLPSDPPWAGEDVFTENRSQDTTASAAALWRVIEQIGGENGWYSLPFGWTARAAIDQVVGGPGLRKRKSPGGPAVGQPLDWWRVEAIEPGKMLRLRAETKMPGTAWLELTVVPTAAGSRLQQRTVFYARGLAGLAYWYGQLPLHRLVFATMVRNIVKEAEKQRDPVG